MKPKRVQCARVVYDKGNKKKLTCKYNITIQNYLIQTPQIHELIYN